MESISRKYYYCRLHSIAILTIFFFFLAYPKIVLGIDNIHSVDFTSNQSKIAFNYVGDSVVHLYELDNNKHFIIKTNIGVIEKLKIGKQNKLLYIHSKSNQLAIFDLSTLSMQFILNETTDFIENNNILYTSDATGIVSEFRISDFNIIRKFKVSEYKINSLSLKKSGSEILIATIDGRVQLLNLKTEKVIYTYNSSYCNPTNIVFNSNETEIQINYGYQTLILNNSLKDPKTCLIEANSITYFNNFIIRNQFDKYNQKNTFGILKRSENNGVIELYENITLENFCAFKENKVLILAEINDKKEITGGFISNEEFKLYASLRDLSILKSKITDKRKLSEFTITQNNGVQITHDKLTPPPTNLNAKLIETNSSLNSIFEKKQKTEQATTEILIQQGYPSQIRDLIVNRDGKEFITIAESPLVKFWDVNTQTMTKEIKLGNYNALMMCQHPNLPIVAVIDVNFEVFFLDTKNHTIINSIKSLKKGYKELDENELQRDIEPNYILWFDKYGNFLNFAPNSFNKYEDYEFQKNLMALKLNFRELLKNNNPSSSIAPIEKISFYNHLQFDDGTRELMVINNPLYNENTYNYSDKITEDVFYSINTFKKKDYWTIIDSARTDTIVFYNTEYDIGTYTCNKNELYLNESLTIKATLNDFKNDSIIYYKTEYPFPFKELKSNQNKSHSIVYSINDKVLYLFDNIKKCTKSIPYSENQLQFTTDNKYFICPDFIVQLENNKSIYYTQQKSKNYIENQDNYKEDKFLRVYYLPKNNKFFVWKKPWNEKFNIINTVDNSITDIILKPVEIGEVQQALNIHDIYINHINYFTKINFSHLTHNCFVATWDNNNLSLTKASETNLLKTQTQFNYGALEFTCNYCSDGPDSNQFTFIIKNYYDKKIKYCLKFPKLTLEKEQQNDSLFTHKMNKFYKDILTPKQRIAIGKFNYEAKTWKKTWETADWRLPYEYKYLSKYNISLDNLENFYSFSRDSLKIALFDENYNLSINNSTNNKIIKKYDSAPIGHYYCHFLPDNNKFLTYGFDGGINLYNIIDTANSPSVRYFQSMENFIFLTPDNYYKTSNKAVNFIKFRKNGVIYGIDQFDLKYNRPDILLRRVNCKDSSLVSSFYKAYKKRLAKMNFTEDMLKEDFHLPEIKITNRNQINTETTKNSISVNLEITDSKYNLDRVNVFINDVPIYGIGGINLRENSVLSKNLNLDILLISGENKIQVSALNQAGAESYRENIIITYKPLKTKKPDLYLITIGTSKYQNNEYDLKYAAKDASDIKSLFESNTNGNFSTVYTYSLVNEEVNLEAISKIKGKLANAKREDVVILSIAGHGVLDKNLDYYLATYSIDFYNPQHNGLSYENLESMLDNILPLKKILLIDACHSGEVDKEELMMQNGASKKNESISFRSAGPGVQKKKLGLQSTSELMSELFIDLRRGTGATVIASSGGGQYSMESDEWKNGLFTYCLLKGIKDKDADLDKDGLIMLSEIQFYLNKEVSNLSNGEQQPTSRIENLQFDFPIWQFK